MKNATTFADRYQSILVPVIFEPWAKELIRRAEPQPDEHVLDLACGTGVVTREVAASVPAAASLSAVDHSSEMLDVARLLAKEGGLDVEWIEADAAAFRRRQLMTQCGPSSTGWGIVCKRASCASPMFRMS